MALLNRLVPADPRTPPVRSPRRWGVPVWQDVLVTGLVAVCSVLMVAFMPDDGRSPDALGRLLLGLTILPLLWRSRWPYAVLFVHLFFAAAYHAHDYNHAGPVAASMVTIYSATVAGPRRRTLWVCAAALGALLVVWSRSGPEQGLELLRVLGWILAVIALGEAVRVHREYIAAIRERAERAERTREEEAARRVAEERVRIARDLHDLLAHSITRIGVQTSVASHVLIADPGRLDRAALAQALDQIADTCRDARVELRRTVEVLRADAAEPPDPGGPLPGLGGLPDLVRGAREAGARAQLTVDAARPLPAAVTAAAYRIVQEALTNAVRHAGPGARVRVTVRDEGPALRTEIADDGPRPGVPASGSADPPGFGIAGMRERARSVGGTLHAGPRTPGPGFTVTALLPVEEQPVDRAG